MITQNQAKLDLAKKLLKEDKITIDEFLVILEKDIEYIYTPNIISYPDYRPSNPYPYDFGKIWCGDPLPGATSSSFYTINSGKDTFTQKLESSNISLPSSFLN